MEMITATIGIGFFLSLICSLCFTVLSFYGIYLCFIKRWYYGVAALVVPGFAAIIAIFKLFKKDILK